MRLAVIVPNDCTADLRNLEHRRLHCRNLRSATARATNGSGAGEIGPAEGIPDPGCSWCNPPPITFAWDKPFPGECAPQS